MPTRSAARALVPALAAGLMSLALAACEPQATPGAAATPPATMEGTWRIVLDDASQQEWVIVVTGANEVRLVELINIDNPDFGEIALTRTGGGLVLTMEQAQDCGPRTLRFDMAEAGAGFEGELSGPAENCTGGTFRSADDAVTMTRG